MRKILHDLKRIYSLITIRPSIKIEAVDYDEYWKERRRIVLGVPNSFQRFRAEWIAARVDNGASVLDLGCGDGAVLLHIKKFKDIKAIGVDKSSYALDFLKTQGVETIKSDFTNLEEIERLPKVDYVLLLEVLEHLRDAERLLNQVMSKVKKAVFFSVPNTGFIAYRLRLLFGSFPVQWRVHPGEHVRFWTFADMKWWLQELGYWDKAEVVAYEGVSGLNRLFPSLFGMGLLVCIKMK